MIQCEICHWTAVVADVFTVLGVIIAATLGIMAYTSWKRELTGTAKFELARNLLRTITLILESLDLVVEDPITPEYSEKFLKLLDIEEPETIPVLVELVDQAKQRGTEIPKFLKKWYSLKSPEQEIKILAEKWKPVQGALNDFNYQIFEAQYLLDDHANKLIGKVRVHIEEIDNAYTRLTDILSEMKNNPSMKSDPEVFDLMQEQYEILFNKKKPTDISAAIGDLDGYFRKRYF